MSIEADLRGMQEVAVALHAELEQRYIPLRDQVDREMIVEVSPPDERFLELCHLLKQHWTSRFMTTALLTEHGNATWTFATAAQTVSARHDEADELARIRSHLAGSA